MYPAGHIKRVVFPEIESGQNADVFEFMIERGRNLHVQSRQPRLIRRQLYSGVQNRRLVFDIQRIFQHVFDIAFEVISEYYNSFTVRKVFSFDTLCIVFTFFALRRQSKLDRGV